MLLSLRAQTRTDNMGLNQGMSLGLAKYGIRNTKVPSSMDWGHLSHNKWDSIIRFF